MTAQHTRKQQAGSTLFLTLIMLVVLTIISLATLGTSLMELRMSNNAEAAMAANESAQSVLEAVISDLNNFSINGAVNTANCSSGVSGCATNNVSIPAPFDSTSQVKITRLTDTDCPFRSSYFSSTCSNAKSAQFDVYAKFDRSSIGQGKVELNHGYIAVFPVTAGGSPVGSNPNNSTGN